MSTVGHHGDVEAMRKEIDQLRESSALLSAQRYNSELRNEREHLRRELEGAHRGIRRLRRRLDRARREASGQAGWVPVERTLPEEYVSVLISEDEDGTSISYRDGSGHWAYGCNPTHWRPLPPGPEGA